ncbi:unnamed protein product [Mytilus coruscus]|uniref:Uncharacterized protein n=1 Tax=Mytilus coruscus TaxID=42192 RepID=A0A6J8BYT3_MYTCO|nr:unnamed protein product [Mytilus coruscus]
MEVFDIDCGSSDVSLQYRIRTGQSVVKHLNDTRLQHTYSCNDQKWNIPEFCTTNSNDKESLYVNLVADKYSASRIVFNVRSGDKYKLDSKNTFVDTSEDKGKIHYIDLLENGPIPLLTAIFGTLFIVAIVATIALCRRYRRKKARRERIRNVEREVYGI